MWCALVNGMASRHVQSRDRCGGGPGCPIWAFLPAQEQQHWFRPNNGPGPVQTSRPYYQAGTGTSARCKTTQELGMLRDILHPAAGCRLQAVV